jgi:two-component system, NarL family, invasion response regulator UvrY
MIKVFIVDDHEIFREGLKRILNTELDFSVVGEAENGNDLLVKILETECDIILLDLNIPGPKGVELINNLRKINPAIQTLILSIYPEDNIALPLLKAGASGYLCKDSALSELVEAIRKIYTKGRYVSKDLAEHLAFNLLSDEKDPHRKLTKLEISIMKLIAKGEEYSEIAQELTLSINSVTAGRRKIFEKLNIKNNVQLTHYVLNNNLLEN